MNLSIEQYRNGLKNEMYQNNYGQKPTAFSNMHQERWKAILQQIAQYADPKSLQLYQQAFDDSTKANTMEQYVQMASEKMEAAQMKIYQNVNSFWINAIA